MNTAMKLEVLEFDEYFVDTPSVRLCVREYGDPKGTPVLMIMGLGCQMTHWPDHLLEQLLQKPIRLICFDNRDIGLSGKIKSQHRIDTRLAYLSHKLGLTPSANYTLHDMAADTSHLITALNLGSTHVIGVSMGGMIGQILAANYTEQLASLSIMMSSTNSPKLPFPDLSLMIKFGLSGRRPKSEEDQIKRWMGFWKLIQSPEYPTPKHDIEAMVRAGFERDYSPAGTLRQLQAILSTGSLEKYIKNVPLPTRVIHGSHDPLLKPACGRIIAKRIPRADFYLVPGMGHDLPRQLSPKLSHLILEHIEQAERTQR
ncbi:hypothetical protein A3752_01165 [Oleiphilus sp. HI0081]|uniref:alpha/beta fold hydrolase n=1 Tax=Oleiphilus sp. HI0132 TaxID=1822270 RepID=UPI0007C22D75|nr:alpha/beta hydrolase [Oleiphilus sp. HI0132]KZY88624.1 hypothetical protein A3743_11195 [Oleiphilus sp. HI0072]KZZ21291.1 hypothetical protein A3752_01165 [Oleiphilus sp. HI0081]KZZ80325.1 hypothetical protein A3766_09060 [Oleiphilus sp. HI0132]